ncbi:ESX-3 secretion system protein EccE3 [Mycobacteroides abscessus subsp. abscessus]|nr:ESX-3 secretion system protein EccE3 [Mycobacteroides abscessus subsp. abscessus]
MRETADTVARRLADHLRELGWHVTATEAPEEPLSPEAKEGSRGVSDDHGYLAAYRVAVNNDLSETLDNVGDAGLPERWMALELTGTTDAPRLTAVCALRTQDKPAAHAPLAGLTPCWGEHLLVLRSLNPLSSKTLAGADAAVTAEFLDGLTRRDQEPALV